MLVNFRRFLAWIIILGAFFHSVAFANSWSSQAMELAAENKFDQALSVLAAEPINVQQSYDHRFLKARILSWDCLLYTSPSPRDGLLSRMPSSA